MRTSVLIFCLIFLIKCDCVKTKLEYVQVFFRHGSRIPDMHELYPTDPHNDFLIKSGLGKLTEDGKEESCKLGNALRNRYKYFLNEANYDSISTQSSSSNRTRSTAKLVLNGIFAQPCIDDPAINYTITSKEYEMNLVRFYCPVYLDEYNRLLNTRKTKKLLMEKEGLFHYISQNTQQQYTLIREVFFLYETLAAEKVWNLTLPSWVEKVYDQIKSVGIMQLKYESGSPILKRLNGGRMLVKVVDNMQNKIQGKLEFENKKLNLFSGHEFTIAGILSTLNVFKPHFPNFNSAVALELYRRLRSNEYYVKVVYFKNLKNKPKILQIPKCRRLCRFSNFLRFVSSYLPENYTRECNSDVSLD